MKALGILSRIRDTRTNCLWGNHWTPLSYTKDTILLFLLLIKSEGKDQAYRPIPSIFLTRNSPADPLEQFAHRYFLRGLEQACVPALQPSQGWLCLATRGGGTRLPPAARHPRAQASHGGLIFLLENKSQPLAGGRPGNILLPVPSLPAPSPNTHLCKLGTARETPTEGCWQHACEREIQCVQVLVTNTS